MPNRPSAKKSIRQSEKHRLRNRALKSEAKSLMKRVAAAVSARDAARAREALNTAQSRLDKIAKLHVWHRNNVARKKAHLAKLVATLSKPASPAAAEPA